MSMVKICDDTVYTILKVSPFRGCSEAFSKILQVMGSFPDYLMFMHSYPTERSGLGAAKINASYRHMAVYPEPSGSF